MFNQKTNNKNGEYAEFDALTNSQTGTDPCPNIF